MSILFKEGTKSKKLLIRDERKTNQDRKGTNKFNIIQSLENLSLKLIRIGVV
jgi:hypothetical protein